MAGGRKVRKGRGKGKREERMREEGRQRRKLEESGLGQCGRERVYSL